MSFFINRDGFLVSTAEAHAWLAASQRLADEGNINGAMDEVLKALSWFQSAGPSAEDDQGLMECRAGEGSSLAQIGVICTAAENWTEAARYFRQSRDVWIKAWEYEEQARLSVNAGQNANMVCLNLALVAGYLEKYEESLQLADSALSFFEETEDLENQIQALLISAGSNDALGNKKKAAERYRNAASLAREIGDASLEKQINSQLKHL